MPDLKSFLVLGATCCFATLSGLAFAQGPAAWGPRRMDADPPPELPAAQEQPLVEASPVRKNIGIAFTAVGIVNMTLSSGVIAWLTASFGDIGAALGGVYAGPVHVEGTALMAVGVSLWVSGSERVRPAAPAPTKPELNFGPGTASAKWAF
ncbi:MAG: hypothetical protein HOV80_29935 [Polyangiaceae bacterium]|nr:hypothetical protein [Polyangiaceae bacterium]